MKIVELTLFHVRIPLRKKIRHASHVRTETDNVIVRLALDSGHVGHGEGVPREYVTGEDIGFTMDLLKRADLAAQLEPVHDWSQALTIAERLKLPPVDGDIRHCKGNAARCAIEIAYLDAIGQAFGQPLSQVAKSLTPDVYSPRDNVQYSGALTSSKNWKTRIAAFGQRIYGFSQIKVKVGTAGQDDAKRLRAIRFRVGRKMDLRIDANEAWLPDEALSKILELRPFGITSVEQPLPQTANSHLPALRKEMAIPVMLDESLCSRVDAENAIENQWCDLFNIRLSKCGGLIPSLRLAELAKRSNLGYQLGCQVGETAILSAAGRHFATSVADIRYLEGSYDKHLVREALATEDMSFRMGGWAPALTKPGLGIEIDPTALERVTVRKDVLLAR